MKRKTITVKWLESINACGEAVEVFADQNEKDALKVLGLMIKQKKLSWANWLIVRLMTYKKYVSYAVYAAEQVINIYEKRHPGDNRPREAIKAAKRCIKNPSRENKAAAVAYAVADADDPAAYAAYAAAYATVAYAGADAAYAAAYAVGAADADKMKIKILRYGIKLLRK